MSATPSSFAGFGARATAWFAGLERDNSREYFERNRIIYDQHIKAPLLLLLEELKLRRGPRLTIRLFRQHRDTRFSKDKAPYKITSYGVLADPSSEDGAYVELSSKGLYAGRGNAKMARDQLARFRAAVLSEESGPALGNALAEVRKSGLTVGGATLEKGPRGFGAHPRAILLRHDSLVAGAGLSARPVLRSRGVIDWVDATWTAAAPLAHWLAKHVGPSDIPPEVRWGGRRATDPTVSR